MINELNTNLMRVLGGWKFLFLNISYLLNSNLLTIGKQYIACIGLELRPEEILIKCMITKSRFHCLLLFMHTWYQIFSLQHL